jgi:hypothetical protein
MRTATVSHLHPAVVAASFLLVACSAVANGDAVGGDGGGSGSQRVTSADSGAGSRAASGSNGGGHDATTVDGSTGGGETTPGASYNLLVAAIPNLELWLPLDETSGAVAVDHSPNRWNGAYPSSGVTYDVANSKAGPGADAAAVTLDSTATLSVPHHSALELSTGASARWTVMLWAKVLTTAAGTYPPLLLMGNQHSTGWGVLYSNEYHTVIFGSGNGQSAVATPILTDTLHMIGVTFDGTTVSFYVDGAPLGSDPGAAGVTVGDATSSLLIGPNLTVDQVIVAGSALTAAQHQALFDGYTGVGSSSGLAGDGGVSSRDAGSRVDSGGAVGSGGHVNTAPSGPSAPAGGWHVDFADDFNAPLGTGSGQDNFWYPSQSWNGTLSNNVAGNNSYETEVYNASQVSVSGGLLSLTATYQVTQGGNYVSGIVTTPVGNPGYQGFTWTPGDGSTWAFEIVCKWPVDTGELFNAWWSSTQSGWSDERDFFEGHHSAGIDTDWIFSTAPVNQEYYSTTLGFDPSAAMHRYTYVVFSDQSWSTYIDGTLQTWAGNNGISPPESSNDVPMELIINYALDATTFTSGSRTFFVDSVAVYQDGAHAGQSMAGGGIAPGTVVGP